MIESKGEDRGKGHGTMSLPNTLLTVLHLFCDMIILGQESTIAFSAIDKSVAFV